ncbi:hypothetical protein [Herbaspirillum sp.]|uniref:hypothetical protein n=1 Tax=Herbaspirillum sp. TaxID=1890675 RepID=UPI0031DF0433
MKAIRNLGASIAAFIVFAGLASYAGANDAWAQGSGADRCGEKTLQQNGKPVLKVALCSEQSKAGGYYVLTNLLNANARTCGTITPDNHEPVRFCTTLKGGEIRKSMCRECGAVIGSAELASYAPSDTRAPFSSYQDGYCMKFTYIVRNQVAGFLKELEEETPYPIDDYFQTAGCRQKGWGGDVLSPMMHLIGDDPAGRVEFAEVIYKYYTIKRKDPQLWLAAVNARNTLGETVLDYLDHLVAIQSFYAPESKNAVAQITAFLCAKGGVYAKYGKKCP